MNNEFKNLISMKKVYVSITVVVSMQFSSSKKGDDRQACMHYNRLQENPVTITGMIYSEVPNK